MQIQHGTSLVCQLDEVSVSNGTWSGSPTSYSYQWYNTDGAISGATSSTYMVQAGDDGLTLYCEVTATNATGSNSANSAPTPEVGYYDVESCITPPNIDGATSGHAIVGELMSVTYTGVWIGCPEPGSGDFSYQWVIDGTGDISGATSSSYLPVSGDIGSAIFCRLTAPGGGYGVSAPMTVEDAGTIPSYTGVPSAAGMIAVGSTLITGSGGTYCLAGDTLGTNEGTWDGATYYTYQWTFDGSPNVSETNSTYLTTNSDVGVDVGCEVAGCNSHGCATAEVVGPVTVISFYGDGTDYYEFQDGAPLVPP
jgi:hypothetical protein